MAPKTPIAQGLISGHAPGYWGGGGGIRCRINQEAIADKVLALNYEKIVAMGMPLAIWREAKNVLDNPLQCTCFKDTAKQPDIPCAQCYGTGFIPGYLKFGTQNFWVEAPRPSGGGFGSGGFGQEGFGEMGDWSLANVVLDTTNRPFRFMLSSTATVGSAVSPNLTISASSLARKVGAWEAKADMFTRDGGANSSITIEASKDNGSTWFALSQLEAQAPTQLKFRVTFNRTATTVKSPMFEIVRARFPVIRDILGELSEPVIRVLPTWLTEAEIRQAHGLKLESQGNKFWTLPLGFFDTTINTESRASRINDDVLVEDRLGADVGYRYAITEFSYSDTFGRFTRQEFSMRKVAGAPNQLTGEQYYRVF